MAQSFPSQPIRVEVGFAPGGVGDISARIVAQRMSESLGQQVLIENRPSAGQAVASEIVAKAAPDGYTLLLLSQAHAVSVSLFKSLPYDVVKDFAPISTFGYFGMAIAVDASAPFKTLAALISTASR